MGLKDLLDMSEVNAVPHAKAKYDIPTRLDEKTAKDVDDTKAWEACKKRVDKRDKYQCRKCERKVVYTLELQGNRAEHHHLARRAKEPALLTDERNVLLVCCACHQQITRRRWHIIGTAAQMFTHAGQRYLDARKPLQFRKAEK